MKLVRFLMNLNTMQKKVRVKKDNKKSIKSGKVEDLAEDKSVAERKTLKKSIFLIRKQEAKINSKSVSEKVENDIEFSDISMKRSENCHYDYLKLKRDLREKKTRKKAVKSEIKLSYDFDQNTLINRLISCQNIQNQESNNLLQMYNNNIQYNNKFDEMKLYFNNISPKNASDQHIWFNDADVGNNNVFNEIDFLNNVDICNDKNKITIMCDGDNENLENYFNVHNNTENYENYLNK